MSSFGGEPSTRADLDRAESSYAEPDWVGALTAPGPGREVALRELHALLLRAARFQVSRMPEHPGAIGQEQLDDIVNLAADEAMVAVLRKLPTFEGRSRFTTWAYKFAILQAAVEVRRHRWAGREVPLETAPPPTEASASPEQYAEATDFARATRYAIDHVLTRHQRRIALAVIVDDVPIDVLAERLGTTRNALYKTVHDARTRLRAYLVEQGYLTSSSPTKGDLR